MRKLITLLLLLVAFVLPAAAQSQQDLINAYRNGTLTQSQIDNVQKQGTKVNRNRQVTNQAAMNNSQQKPASGQPVPVVQQDNVEKSAPEIQQTGYYSKDGRFIPGIQYIQMPDGTYRFNTKDPRYKLLKQQSEGFNPNKGRLEFVADSLKRDSLLKLMPELADMIELSSDWPKIFGKDLLSAGSTMTFEPNLSIATPDNYVLGAGDEVIIDVWGDAQSSEAYTVSPDGKIYVPNVGPITLSGLTMAEATRRVRSSLVNIYEGLYDGSVQMKLSLGSIRSIQVNVMGEVGHQGTYTLPSLATLFHALHVSGGVNDLGTLRSIKLYRSGKLYSEVDVYDYILNGKTESDIALRDGDLISVLAYGKLVEVSGEVKRPMFYEMRTGETIADVINFAGGFTNEANGNVVSVTRRQGGKYQSFTVENADFDKFVVEDGDVVSVAGSLDRYENRVEIKGAVYREGFYAINEQTRTLKQLIARADGLREDAFMSRAVLYREKPDWTMEAKSIDLAGLMAGRVADIALRANDILLIASVSDMQEDYNVTIFGSVSRPDTYPYAENMTVEDLLVAAGGLLESASTANVTITRRIKDSKSLDISEQLFETFTIDINDNLAVNGSEFVLQPFDQVYVRRSPVYIMQSSVTVNGEVAFEGNYPLSHRNMRISEVIAAAGGPNPGAFIEGAYLLRRMTDEENHQSQALTEMIDKQAKNERDSMSMESVSMKRTYTVGIDLKQALANPGSDADVVLRDGDVVTIPQYNGTVRVMGAVLYPNSVTFQEGKSLKYYVKSAGGFDNNARKSHAFVIYMNGMVASKKSAEIRPGCIIIIPSKTQGDPVKWNEVVSMLSSTASMSAVVLSAINLARN